jgi:threonine/homoserine/homoserine lactone efflux protein
MTPEKLWAFSLFALVSSITPGPNNAMLLASGVNFGMRRSLPHLAGICLGFGFMLAAVGLGLHKVLQAYPLILEVLRYAGALYMVWLAYQLATANTHVALVKVNANHRSQPMRFWAAAAFQWVNPKAWVMAMTAMTAYLPAPAATLQIMLLVAVFVVVNAPCVASWAAFGSGMRKVLQNPMRLRIFNVCMAVGLVASLYPVLVS